MHQDSRTHWMFPRYHGSRNALPPPARVMPVVRLPNSRTGAVCRSRTSRRSGQARRRTPPVPLAAHVPPKKRPFSSAPTFSGSPVLVHDPGGGDVQLARQGLTLPRGKHGAYGEPHILRASIGVSHSLHILFFGGVEDLLLVAAHAAPSQT